MLSVGQALLRQERRSALRKVGFVNRIETFVFLGDPVF